MFIEIVLLPDFLQKKSIFGAGRIKNAVQTIRVETKYMFIKEIVPFVGYKKAPGFLRRFYAFSLFGRF